MGNITLEHTVELIFGKDNDKYMYMHVDVDGHSNQMFVIISSY